MVNGQLKNQISGNTHRMQNQLKIMQVNLEMVQEKIIQINLGIKIIIVVLGEKMLSLTKKLQMH